MGSGGAEDAVLFEHDVFVATKQLEHFSQHNYAYKPVNNSLVFDELYAEAHHARQERQLKNFYRTKTLKQLLKNTDYQALKFSEGSFSEAEFAPIRAQRRAWRDEINQLEEELA